jgi:predicted ArsR family transcriptional regulator
MNATDIRDMTFDEIRDELDGPRHRVWEWLFSHGPATTSAIAEGTGIGLLTVRPRVSELVAMGFAECTGREKREGVYRAITVAQAQARYAEARAETQLPLKFSTDH